jgi:signal transduction histidine kinase
MGHATIFGMKSNTFDSGLLVVFRLFTAIRLVISILGVIIDFGRFNSAAFRIPILSVISLFESTLLLIYLSSPWMQKILRHWYIPLALVVATLGPVLSVFNTREVGLPAETNFMRATAGQWQLMIVLLIPLILVSWKYSFKIVVIFAAGLAALDILQAVVFYTGMPPLFFIYLTLILFRTLFFLLIGYAIQRLALELRQQNASLEQANQRLSNYALMTEQLTISRERNRLARELHDTLAHTLSGLAIQLEAAQTLADHEPEPIQRTIQSALVQTRQGLVDTRRAIQALRASPLDDLGLGMALEQLASSLAEREGLELHLDLPKADLELPSEIEHSLYRVAEEALRNVEKHANARKVSLELSKNAPRVLLRIQDDGIGFDAAQPQTGDCFGLLGMQERAQAVGGQVQIESHPSQGTTVNFWIEV